MELFQLLEPAQAGEDGVVMFESALLQEHFRALDTHYRKRGYPSSDKSGYQRQHLWLTSREILKNIPPDLTHRELIETKVNEFKANLDALSQHYQNQKQLVGDARQQIEAAATDYTNALIRGDKPAALAIADDVTTWKQDCAHAEAVCTVIDESKAILKRYLETLQAMLKVVDEAVRRATVQQSLALLKEQCQPHCQAIGEYLKAYRAVTAGNSMAPDGDYQFRVETLSKDGLFMMLKQEMGLRE
ncbi:MAG: hypothetical protein R3E95_06815 [Thiolinea sp.]